MIIYSEPNNIKDDAYYLFPFPAFFRSVLEAPFWTLHAVFSTDTFSALKLQNPSNDVSELHKISRLPDSKQLNLWKTRSVTADWVKSWLEFFLLLQLFLPTDSSTFFAHSRREKGEFIRTTTARPNISQFHCRKTRRSTNFASFRNVIRRNFSHYNHDIFRSRLSTFLLV